MEPREFLNILHVAERLKDTTRHCTSSQGRPESVAEHSWRLSLMAMLLRREFPELDIDRVVDMCLIHDLGECFTGDIPAFLKTGADREREDSLLRREFPELDIDRVVDMCLVHDLGECFTGDIPAFVKTEADRETEDSLLSRWVASLPEEVSSELAALYAEMDAQETAEAKLYKALDKLEAVIQHNESPLATWTENEYELNKSYANDAVAFSAWLTALRKEILADTLEKIETEGKN